MQFFCFNGIFTSMYHYFTRYTHLIVVSPRYRLHAKLFGIRIDELSQLERNCRVRKSSRFDAEEIF